VAKGWERGPEIDGGGRWDPADLDLLVPKLVADAHS
jgi:hypothetical protein